MSLFKNQDVPDSGYVVYRGVWINQQRGYVYGATLTLDRQQGAVLIAVLALYAGLAGSGCWKIARLLLHRYFSSATNVDGIYLQRQTILRNSETSHTAAWDLLKASFAWQTKKVGNNFRRLWPVAFASLSLSLTFAAAGILSSHVATTGDSSVLLSDGHCGAVEPNWHTFDFTDYEYSARETARKTQRLSEDLAYAQQCYPNNSRSIKCRTYITPALPYTKVTNAPCPFTGGICATNNSNVILDTGRLESAKHLGINGGPPFQVRQTRVCAPIVPDGFKRNFTDEDTNKEYIGYYFWPPSDEDDQSTNSSILDNLTWKIPKPEQVTFDSTIQYWGSYKTGVSDVGKGTPEVVPEYAKNVVTLIFLDATAILYGNATLDPWFAATTVKTFNETDSESRAYLANEPAAIMGCVTRKQVCNPNFHDSTKACVTTSGFDTNFTTLLDSLWPNAYDRAAVQGAIRFLAWTVDSSSGFNVDIYYQQPGLASLLTQNSVAEGNFQGITVPQNRWQDEMEYTFQASLAGLQAKMLDTATGVQQWINQSIAENVGTPEYCVPEEACKSVCGRQMIKSPGHYSFSLLGTCIIIVAGGLFILAGFWIEGIVFSVERLVRKGGKSYASIEWQNGSAIQLQRLAHEAAGYDVWYRTDGAIPVTESGGMLGVLDTSDHKHARLVRHGDSFINQAGVPANDAAFLSEKHDGQRLETKELR